MPVEDGLAVLEFRDVRCGAVAGRLRAVDGIAPGERAVTAGPRLPRRWPMAGRTGPGLRFGRITVVGIKLAPMSDLVCNLDFPMWEDPEISIRTPASSRPTRGSRSSSWS